MSVLLFFKFVNNSAAFMPNGVSGRFGRVELFRESRFMISALLGQRHLTHIIEKPKLDYLLQFAGTINSGAV